MPLTDIFAAIRWWAVLLLLGVAATPLAYTLFRRLPDRGYAFARLLGLLLASYLFWLLGSLGFLANNLGGILVAVLLLVAASAWAYRRSQGEVLAWARAHARYVLTVEVLFAVIFFLWVWVRAQNPAITGTEKPMEFAFLNAAGRTPTMPLLDPWLSGFAISYYYFGYVMTSVLARLAMVPEPIAFNLGIAWLVAGSALGAFGLVYNLVAAGRKEGERRAALLLGLVAAVALPLAGNLQIILELLHANGIGSAAFWAWLDVRDISGPAVETGFGSGGPRFWWWWRSSRVIHEYHLYGVAEEGLEPIAEFPGFSFILGDMHPHVLALPFAFLSLGVALLWWLRPPSTIDEEAWLSRGLAGRFGLLLGEIGLPTWALTALVLGGLSFLNTWDVLIHLFVVAGAFVLNRWRQRGAWHNRLLGQGVMVGILLALPAILLYLPFYLGFRSQAGVPYLLPMLMRPTRLAHFLIIFGMPLTSIVVLLAVLVARQRRRPWRLALLLPAAIILLLLVLMALLGWVIAVTPEGGSRLLSLAENLGLGLAPQPEGAGRLGWALSAVFRIMPAVLAARLASPWLILLLGTLMGLVPMLWVTLFRERERVGEPAPVAAEESAPVDSAPADGVPANNDYTPLPFVLLLILTGALLTIGPEFVYLRDFFGTRLNTVFKFYYQAWVLFGVSALFALDWLWRRARPAAIAATAVYGLLLALALLFPIFGISSRAQEYEHPPTLSGIDHYRYTSPGEYAALTWLRENVEGVHIILEAVGGSYSPQGHGRVSATTGLPTVLGWPFHEQQWRGDTVEQGEREPAVAEIYGDAPWPQTEALLDRYDVAYIYVGPLEVSTYGEQAREKFEGLLDVAYRNESVTIYRRPVE